MTATEAKARIKREFVEGFLEWVSDYDALTNHEYGKKYGWQKSEKKPTLTIKSLMAYQKYIFSGRWLPAWEKQGFDRKVLWELYETGFLSYQYYSNWNARASGRTDFFYLSQQTAREIWKEYQFRVKNREVKA